MYLDEHVFSASDEMADDLQQSISSHYSEKAKTNVSFDPQIMNYDLDDPNGTVFKDTFHPVLNPKNKSLDDSSLDAIRNLVRSLS